MTIALLSVVGRHGAYLVGSLTDADGSTENLVLDPASEITFEDRTWRPYLDLYDPRISGRPVACDLSQSRVLPDGSLRTRIADAKGRPLDGSIAMFVAALQERAGAELQELQSEAITIASAQGPVVIAKGDPQIADMALREPSRFHVRNWTSALAQGAWDEHAGRTVLTYANKPLEDHHLASFGGYAAIAERIGDDPEGIDLEGIAQVVGRSGDTVITWHSPKATLIASPVLTGMRALPTPAPFGPSLERCARLHDGLRTWMLASAQVTSRNGRQGFSIIVRPEHRRGDPLRRSGSDPAWFLDHVSQAIGDAEEAQGAMAALLDAMDE